MAYPLAGLKGASMLLAGNPPFKNYTHIVLVKCRRRMNSIPQSFAFATILLKSEVTSSVS